MGGPKARTNSDGLVSIGEGPAPEGLLPSVLTLRTGGSSDALILSVRYRVRCRQKTPKLAFVDFRCESAESGLGKTGTFGLTLDLTRWQDRRSSVILGRVYPAGFTRVARSGSAT